jgi:hypothetical protein
MNKWKNYLCFNTLHFRRALRRKNVLKLISTSKFFNSFGKSEKNRVTFHYLTLYPKPSAVGKRLL